MPKTVSKNNKRKLESEDSPELSEDEVSLACGTNALFGAKKQVNKVTKLMKGNARKGKSKPESDESPDLSENEVPLKLDTTAKSSNKTLCKSIESRGLEASKSGGSDCAINAGNVDYGAEFQKMLAMFGSDVSKAHETRKRRLDQFFTGVMKACETKIVEAIQFQVERWKQLCDEMKKNVNSVLDQFTIDMNRAKDQEEKMWKLMQQLIKMNQQTRDIKQQRMAAVQQILEAFEKGYDTKLSEQIESPLVELRKDLMELQKKMMIESQKGEMAHMQKSLQGMLNAW